MPDTSYEPEQEMKPQGTIRLTAIGAFGHEGESTDDTAELIEMRHQEFQARMELGDAFAEGLMQQT